MILRPWKRIKWLEAEIVDWEVSRDDLVDEIEEGATMLGQAQDRIEWLEAQLKGALDCADSNLGASLAAEKEVERLKGFMLASAEHLAMGAENECE